MIAEFMRKALKIQRKSGAVRVTEVSVHIAATFWTRLVGLLSRGSLSANEGLLLVPCGSIHTLGMRFTIDVIYLDKNGRVLGFADQVPPNRFRIAPPSTTQVLEIANGNRIKTGINLDDHLIFD